jgi:thiamine monophosphate synthase
MSVRRRLLLGRRLREATRSNGQLFVVAQRVDLAIALGAEGIHLPAGGLLPSEVERLADFSWVSRAHHGLEALGDAEVKRLSHVFVSPVMADRKGRAALGLAGFRARAASLAVRNHQLQVCALGGVTAATCASLQAAGAGAVCVMGGVCVPGELEGLVRALGIERGSQSE